VIGNCSYAGLLKNRTRKTPAMCKAGAALFSDRFRGGLSLPSPEIYILILVKPKT
jgi:hypothetical protein